MIKKFLLLTIILLSILNITLKGQIDDKSKYEYKINYNTKTRTQGGVLIGVGTGGLVVGAGLMAYLIYGNNNDPEDMTPVYVLIIDGINMISCIPMLIIGGILRTVSNYNIKHYRMKMEKVTYNIIYTPKMKGIGLTFRF